ncbi:MAG: hypothetical protein EA364_15825, partial [Balneolaceae bacterium]
MLCRFPGTFSFLQYTLLAMLLPVICHAGNPEFRHITTQNGLSHNQILDVIQDRAGFIWVATQDGL